MKIYNNYQYKAWIHYVSTISECNNAIITPKVKDLVILGYDIKEAFTKHKTFSIDYFINTKSKQYSKGNLIDEWVWKYPHLIND